jgi:hypothetical protein
VIVAFVAAIAAGTLLPIMNLIFGIFITTFTGFATGATTPAQYRSELNKYTSVARVLDHAESDADCIQSLFRTPFHCQFLPGLFTYTQYVYPWQLYAQPTICAHRLHQANHPLEYRILRFGCSRRLRNHTGHHKWQQHQQQRHFRKADAGNPRRIRLCHRVRHRLCRSMETYLHRNMCCAHHHHGRCNLHHHRHKERSKTPDNILQG